MLIYQQLIKLGFSLTLQNCLVAIFIKTIVFKMQIMTLLRTPKMLTKERKLLRIKTN